MLRVNVKNPEEFKTTQLTDAMIIDVGNYNSFVYQNATNNCKHFYIDRITSSAATNNIEKFVKIIDIITGRLYKTTFSVNTTDTAAIRRLSEHFVLISCVGIPTGYGPNFQYHAIFFVNTNNRGRSEYLRRFKAEGLSPVKFETVGRSAVKAKAPKGSITTSQMERILKYTSKTWLTKYLKTLLS